jgi:hypothetical protein
MPAVLTTEQTAFISIVTSCTAADEQTVINTQTIQAPDKGTVTPTQPGSVIVAPSTN